MFGNYLEAGTTLLDSTKVIAWTPYGREETVSILIEYIKRDVEAGIVDEYHLYMNTDEDQVRDREYAHELNEQYDWVQLRYHPHDIPLKPKQLNTGKYYRYAVEPNTVYVRFDDDIVYIHSQAIERLVRRKLSSPALVCFPLIWHNATTSYYSQQFGKIPLDWGIVKSPYCMDTVGWSNALFAEGIHRLLLGHIRNDSVEDLFWHHDVQIEIGTQFSVSSFAAHSDIYREMNPPGFLDHEEEEHWHTVDRPVRTGRPNSIVGNALVSHLSFMGHTNYIRRETDIMQQYKELSEAL